MTATAIDAAYATYQVGDSTLSDLVAMVRTEALQRTGDADAAQDVALRTIERIGTLQITKSFSSWLSGQIKRARYSCIDELVRARRLRPLDDSCHIPPPRVKLNTDGVGDLVLHLTQPNSLERALADLILTGLTIKAAATAVGLSEAAARKRLRRLAPGAVSSN